MQTQRLPLWSVWGPRWGSPGHAECTVGVGQGGPPERLGCTD